MVPRDPTADTEPDFGSDCWNPTREVMVNQELSTERAIEILRQSWRAQRQKDIEVWNEHLQQLQPEEDRRQRDRDNPTGSIADEEPEWLPTPSFLDNQPACHVLEKLEKKEYVELWYFKTQSLSTPQLLTTPSAWPTPRKTLCPQRSEQLPCHRNLYGMSFFPGTSYPKDSRGC